MTDQWATASAIAEVVDRRRREMHQEALDKHWFTESKTVGNSLYHAYGISRFAKAVIDTPEFCRLADIRQTGVCYRVYPDATHMRSAHSMGAYALGKKWYRKLVQNTPTLSDKDREALLQPRQVVVFAIALMLHDIGHGPFSHGFDNHVANQVFSNIADLANMTNHEHRSVVVATRILHRLFARRDELDKTSAAASTTKDGTQDSLRTPTTLTLEGTTSGDTKSAVTAVTPAMVKQQTHKASLLSDVEIAAVGCMIMGQPLPSTYPGNINGARNWMSEVVHNRRCGVDADRLNYLELDSRMIGRSLALRIERILDNSQIRVDEDNKTSMVQFNHAKTFHPILEIMLSRASMFREVYRHPVVVGHELLMRDIMLRLIKVDHWEDKLKADPDWWLTLTDGVILSKMHQLAPDLAAAWDTRNIYRRVSWTRDRTGRNPKQVQESLDSSCQVFVVTGFNSQGTDEIRQVPWYAIEEEDLSELEAGTPESLGVKRGRSQSPKRLAATAAAAAVATAAKTIGTSQGATVLGTLSSGADGAVVERKQDLSAFVGFASIAPSPKDVTSLYPTQPADRIIMTFKPPVIPSLSKTSNNGTTMAEHKEVTALCRTLSRQQKDALVDKMKQIQDAIKEFDATLSDC
jgi:HD superfamily phosphohydrolase